VAWGNGHWLALGSDFSEGPAVLVHSTDGVCWTHRPTPPVSGPWLASARLVFTGDRFFLLWSQPDEQGRAIPQVHDSPDGLTWRETDGPRDKDGQKIAVSDIVHGEGVWVVVGPEGLLAHSTDLANWTVVDSPSPAPSIRRVVFLNDSFYAFAQDPYGVVPLRSSDGRTWTELEKPVHNMILSDLATGLIGPPGLPQEPTIVITGTTSQVLIGYPEGETIRWDSRNRRNWHGPMVSRVSQVDGQSVAEWVNVRSENGDPELAVFGLHDPAESSPRLEETRAPSGLLSVATSPEAMIGVGKWGTIRRISLVTPTAARVPALTINRSVELRWTAETGKLYQVEESDDGSRWRTVEPLLVPGTGTEVRRPVAGDARSRQFRVAETGPLQGRQSWEVIPSPTAQGLSGVAWGNGHWLALGYAESPNALAATILHSSDGLTWTVRPSPPFTGGRLDFAGDRFFVFNRTYPGPAGSPPVMEVFDSTDGQSWRETPVPMDISGAKSHVTDIIHAEGRWVAVGLNGLFAWANELGQWQIDGYRSTTDDLSRVVHLNGVFCALGNDSAGIFCFFSRDGTTWELANRPSPFILLGPVSVGLFGPHGGPLEQALVVTGSNSNVVLIGRPESGNMRWNTRVLDTPAAGFANRLSRLNGLLRSEWVSFGESAMDGTTSVYLLHPSAETNVRREQTHSPSGLQRFATGPDAFIGVGPNGTIRRYPLPAEPLTPVPTLVVAPTVEVRWSSQPGFSYRLEATENLQDWALATEAPLAGTGFDLFRHFEIDRPVRQFRVSAQ